MATAEFKVFHGVGAVIAKVTSHTKVSVFAIVSDQAPVDFSATKRRFDVNLKATPRNLPFTGSAIQCDDRGTDDAGNEFPLDAVRSPLGITTLGSGGLEDLPRGRFAGIVYIEHEHYDAIRPTAIDPDPWPPDPFKLFQITSVAYSKTSNGARAGRRYHGFRATVTEVAGRQVQLTFQSHDGAEVLGPFPFNLDDATQCDGDPPAIAFGEAPSIAARPTKGAQGAFFVALPHAVAIDLTGGKIPIGLDGDPREGVQARRTRRARDPEVSVEGRDRAPPIGGSGAVTRINVSVFSDDHVLAQTMANIGDEVLVEGALGDRGVEGVLKHRLPARGAQASGCTLDLIAHAANGVLQFGDWLIDAEDKDHIDRTLSHRLGQSKPKSIRLLGCNTAATQAGQNAMRHHAEIFGVPIFGATVPLFAFDFDSGGLSSRGEFALTHTDNLITVDPEVSDAAVERWFGWFHSVALDLSTVVDRLRPETLGEATLDVQRTRSEYRWPVRRFAAEDRQRLFAQLIPQLATAPGLLAVPDWLHPDREFEALFPTKSVLGGARFHRATILFGGRFVRIYPSDFPDGVILRSSGVLQLDGGTPVTLSPPATHGT